MPSSPSLSWFDRVQLALHDLAERRGLLLLLLLALNALARPYAGVIHDAKLYAVQVLNLAEPGTFADDLFLRFGSQDDYTLFSRGAVPLVRLLGVESAFFLLYLVFNSLFLFGLQRLILALIRDRAAAVLALFYACVAPLPYGGMGIFVANEAFFTARLIACALVLHALADLLAHRFGRATVLLSVALLIHPLMAFGGVLVLAAYLGVTYLRAWMLTALLAGGALLVGAALSYEPVVARLGTVDPEWHAAILAITEYNFPLRWGPLDWLNTAACFIAASVAAFDLHCGDVRRERFAGALLLAGAIGLAGTITASLLPYALPFQGQPYRVLWILKAAQVGYAFEAIAQYRRAPGALKRLAALIPLLLLSVTHGIAPEFVLLALPVPIMALAFRIAYPGSDRATWLWWSGSRGIIVGAGAWAVYKCAVVSSRLGELRPYLDGHDYPMQYLGNLGPVLWLVGVTWLLVRLREAGRLEQTLRWACPALALALQLPAFALPCLPGYREALTRDGADLAFAREYLAGRRAPGRSALTVYCNLGRVDRVWIDLHAQSYFDGLQLAGVMFQRRTALEGRRRARLVRAFEFERLRRDEFLMTESGKRACRLLFEGDFDEPAPDEADLARLCREPGLDYLVLTSPIAGLPAATNGHVHVYDCRAVRAALRLPEPETAPALAARRTDAPISP